MKHKLSVIICVLGFIMAAAMPAVTGSVEAKGAGAARMTAPRSAMPAATKTAPNTTTKSNAASSSQQTTQSKQNTANDTKAQTSTAAQTRQNTASSGSFFGGAMRNIGLLAGGMFLGSMLSSLFGMGNMGFMAELLGMFFNIILLLLVINVVKWLWQKLRRRSGTGDDAYRRGYEAAMREQQKRRDPYTIDVKPIDEEKDPFRK